MNFLTKILLNLLPQKIKHKEKNSNYIFYKIIDSFNDNTFTLQCINTNTIFYAKITDIIFDTNLLHGLHPIQACFIGIEYAKHIKKHESSLNTTNISSKKMNPHSLNRYGCYSLSYQNRNGELYFINKETNEQFIMKPIDIAFSKELIAEFDATQAFYIGLLAGLKIDCAAHQNKNYTNIRPPILYLIK